MDLMRILTFAMINYHTHTHTHIHMFTCTPLGEVPYSNWSQQGGMGHHALETPHPSWLDSHWHSHAELCHEEVLHYCSGWSDV